MSKTLWMVTTGSYSDYTPLVVARTRDDAQRWADTYNAERESQYRDEAEIEEIELYEPGDPLPRRITLWNGDERHIWPVTQVTATPVEDFKPRVDAPTQFAGRRVFVQNFPTEEAARVARDEALRTAP